MEMKRALTLCTVLAVAMPCALRAEGTFPVTRSSVISFGEGGGDAFGLDGISRDDATVLVLIQPQGESCTLRFPIRIGEVLKLRASDAKGHPLVCEASLVSITDEATARFSSRCSEQAARDTEPKCPSEPTSASATGPGSTGK
jgi:hypothetical protein